MSNQNLQTHADCCIQTNDNSMDLYDSLESYFNPQCFIDQEQLVQELYQDPQDDEQNKVGKKIYAQNNGFLEDIPQVQGKPQTFNFLQLEQFSETTQQLKKKPLNIGQIYMQQLEKQVSTLKKIELKFAVNNDENNSIQANQINKRRSNRGKIQIKSQAMGNDQSEKQGMKRASHSGYFQESNNSYIRIYNKNDELINMKYQNQQMSLNNANLDVSKTKGMSQHSAINLNNSSEEGYYNNSPLKKQSQQSQKKIRAMTSNQQFRSSLLTIKQNDPQNFNSQINQFKNIISDLYSEIKNREANGPSNVVLLNINNSKHEQQINKSGPLLNLLQTQNQLQQNQKSMLVQKIPVNYNQKHSNQVINVERRQIQSAKPIKLNQQNL